MSVVELQEKYEKANQNHLYDHLLTLQPGSELYTSYLQQLQELDVERVNSIYANALIHETQSTQLSSASSIDDKLTPPNQDSYDSVLSSTNPDQINKWYNTGLEAISHNQLAVLLLAGGQGTRLGSSDPKGCFDINLPSNSSLFKLQSQRIKSVQNLADNLLASSSSKNGEKCYVTWFIMTSQPTHQPTIEYFNKNDFFGLDPNNVFFFKQGTLPCLTNDGKIILSAKGQISAAPDGNGGIYSALRSKSITSNFDNSKSSVLDIINKRSIKYTHVFGVDNSLIKVGDPTFIGFCIQRNASLGVKVVRKTDPKESVGVVAQKKGKFHVVEYSEIPSQLAEMKDQSGQLAFRFALIVQQFFTTEFLNKVESMESKMPFHIARKKIPYLDESSTIVNPTSPNGIKMELFIFDVFPMVNDLAILEVAREEEFSALKNASGSKSDCPETSRSDVLSRSARWLRNAGARSVENDVEICPCLSYQGEGLEIVQGCTVKSGIANSKEELKNLLSTAQ